ncbi:MAG: hypothetical protein WAV32_02380 [Halobacteriota archaeon]
MGIWSGNKNRAAYYKCEQELLAKCHEKPAVFCDGKQVSDDIEDRETVEVACIEAKTYSEKLPEVTIGRTFLNTYFITLNGEEICIKRKEVESQKNA